ncbi:MAG: transposase [Bacteriovoracaceae bacterium]|nr:transposase [Bacteriovoracaceae bacterium]
MPRKPIVRSNHHYYHVVARSNNKEFFYLELGDVWEIMAKKLGELQKKHHLKIGAFVLMNNHFHLLVLTPDEDIDRVMYFFMKEVTLMIQKRTGRINKIFGGRYKGCIIEHHRYLMNVYKYIYRNPIGAGASVNAESYPFSSLFYQLNPLSKLSFEIEKNFEFQQGSSNHLEWINASFRDEEVVSIKGGLTKSVFSYRKNRSNGKIIEPKVYNEALT